MSRLTRRTLSLMILMVLFSIGVSLVALICLRMRNPSPTELFQRIVIRPIPRSVQDIEADVCYQSSRWDRLTGWDQHEYLLRFDVSKEDLSKVLASDSFTELGFAVYDSGVLILGVTHLDAGHFDLYETKEKEPAWLDLGQWKDTKAWIAEQERKGSWYKAHVVLYNEHLGKAYFYEYETKGEWEGTHRIIRSRTGPGIPGSTGGTEPNLHDSGDIYEQAVVKTVAGFFSEVRGVKSLIYKLSICWGRAPVSVRRYGR